MLLIWALIFFGISVSEAQLYVSKNACLANPNSSPVTSPGTGTGTPQAPTSCDERAYFFEASVNNSGSWTWDFGDGTVQTGGPRNPSHMYTTPNTYTVTVSAIDNGGTVLAGPYTRDILVGYYPDQPLFDSKTEKDTTICQGKTITLDPYKGLFNSRPSNVSYKWFPGGETTSTIDVTDAGCYSVEVIDNLTGCSRSAKINVKLCYEDPSTGGGSEKWYFGYGSGIEFTLTGDEMVQDSLSEDGSLDPQPEITNPSFEPTRPEVNEMRTDEAAAMVFDQNNRLVLYTDGHKLYSGDDDSEIPFLGDDPFAGKNVGAQGVALVPKPVCSACDFINYYLFTVDETTGLLTYSIIDMRENDRRGAVVEANIPLAVNMSGKIIAERSGDDESYFLTAYDAVTGNFQSVMVDSLGTLTTTQTMPPLQAGTVSEGYVAISPDGTQLAHGLVINGENQIQVASRDPETNALSALRTINLIGYPAPPTVYGLAFSPNGAFLYVTLKGDGNNVESKLLQINLADDSVTEIASSREEFGALALGPKYGAGAKYVYVTINNSGAIHYIQEPDEAGRDAVSFTLNQPGNPGAEVAGTTKLGFPNVVAAKPEQDGQGLGANYSGNCLNAPTFLTAQQICDPMKNEFEWEVEGTTYKEESPVHYFSRAGWHDIKLTVKVYRETAVGSGIGNATGGITGNLGNEHCTTVTFEGRIYIKPAPEVSIPDPLYLCTEPPYNGLTFAPQPTGGTTFTYEWLTSGDAPIHANYRDPILNLQANTSSGNFKVKITNEYSCTLEQPFHVDEACEPIVEIPDAFTPNGDGHNETLKVIQHFIERPRLEIFNRWGEQVFQTEDLTEQWDGRYKGQLLSNQLFAYVLRYYARDFPQAGEQKKVGSVLVLTGR